MTSIGSIKAKRYKREKLSVNFLFSLNVIRVFSFFYPILLSAHSDTM